MRYTRPLPLFVLALFVAGGVAHAQQVDSRPPETSLWLAHVQRNSAEDWQRSKAFLFSFDLGVSAKESKANQNVLWLFPAEIESTDTSHFFGLETERADFMVCSALPGSAVARISREPRGRCASEAALVVASYRELQHRQENSLGFDLHNRKRNTLAAPPRAHVFSDGLHEDPTLLIYHRAPRPYEQFHLRLR